MRDSPLVKEGNSQSIGYFRDKALKKEMTTDPKKATYIQNSIDIRLAPFMKEIARGAPGTIGILGTLDSDGIVFTINSIATLINERHQFVFKIRACCLKMEIKI